VSGAAPETPPEALHERLLRGGLAPLITAGTNVTLRALTLAGKFALTLAIARVLGPEALGVYGLVVSAMAISVFALGLEYHFYSIRRLVLLGPDERAALIRDQVVLHGVTLAIAVPLLVVGFVTDVAGVLPPGARFWYVALLALELLSQELGVVLIALERPLQSNAVLFVRSAAWAYLVIPWLVFRPDTGMDMVFAAWWVGAASSLMVAAYYLRDLPWSRARRAPVDWSTIRTGLRVALPFVFTTGASIGMLFVDRFIIEYFLGLTAVGIYTFFAGITTALHTLIYSGVSVVRMPRLVHAHDGGNHTAFRRELMMMVAITGTAVAIVAAVLLLAIDPILAFTGRSVYAENRAVFHVLLAAAAVRCLADIAIYALYARHRDVVLVVVNVGAFAVALAANLQLLPRWGLQGAAIAALIGASTLLIGATLAAFVGRRHDAAAA
jgi:O-antigen/teichoic acid export membrane protein